MNSHKWPMQSNLDCFLRSTTPVVQFKFLPKKEIGSLNRLWHQWERKNIEYFRLSDLWDSYEEWSAYGAGVPVVLDDGQTLVQYYAPYLSAIQIFTSNSSLTSIKEETASGESEARNCSNEALSEASGSEKVGRREGKSVEGGFEQDSPLQTKDRLGYLYFQHFDSSSPYGRLPLIDKIKSFTKEYPGLMTLRNVDLSPATWISVAWYPIYHIPMGRTIKDLSACFLTFHTLSSSFQDDQEIRKKRKEGSGIPLPSFGLATYKMEGNLWISGNYGGDKDRVASLLSIADSWLKQLRVQHHDFNFFAAAKRG